MTRQIAFGYGAPSPANLELRIHELERQVALLTEATKLLTCALAETTLAETTLTETSPAETTLAETTLAETSPAETTLAETSPAETTLAETGDVTIAAVARRAHELVIAADFRAPGTNSAEM